MYFEDLNFLNLPAVRFKRPTAKTIESFYADIFHKFSTEQDEGEKWKDEAFKALIEDDKEKIAKLEKEGGKIIFTDEVIDILIDKYMLAGGIDEEEAEFHKNNILKGGYIQDIEFKHNPEQIVFKTKFGTFKASKLSDVFPIFKKYKGIETTDRHGKCHISSIDISTTIENKNKVATGFMYTFGEGCKYLHSWVEFKDDGRDFVIDATRNLLMPKKFYYYIRNIKGPVYKISSETLEKEAPILDYLIWQNEWLSKLYLSNRHQALQVYNILKTEEERKKMEDPLYAASKHFSESMIKMQKQEEKKVQKQEKDESEKEM